jgi:hypothetical protein
LVDRVAVLGLGAACIVPALGLLWKSASLRGDEFEKWADRVDVAYAGLSERAIQHLRDLQKATDDLLGDPAVGFVPDLAVVDPGPLAKLTGKFERALVARRRLRWRFNSVMSLCAVAPVLVLVYVVGATAALTYYVEWHRVRWIGIAGLITAGAAIVAGTLLVVSYAYLDSRLTTAEIMAWPSQDAHGDGGGHDQP